MKKTTFAKIIVIVANILLCNSCGHREADYQQAAHNPRFYNQSVQKISDVIVHDIFSPPEASRVYAYAAIAGYEALVNEYTDYKSLAGQLNGFNDVPKPSGDMEYCFPLASIQAFLKVGQALIFSEERIEEFREQIHRQFKDMGVPQDVFDRSVAYGDLVGEHVLKWAARDAYKETRSYPKYSISDEPGRWQPTPPDYMDGVEPSWMEIRTLVLDSGSQYRPLPPVPFDTAKSSAFYQDMMKVYENVNSLSDEQLLVAKFWDCNPYISHHKGHVMFATKETTLSGHWMGVVATASRISGADLMKTVQAYALTSISLFDGFISCWDEKYTSNLLRPETAINKYVDPDWRPVLQTPPFPEYTSSHSVVSYAAASALTALYGENFNYIDSVEYEFGLPPRKFKSFKDAAGEASKSGFYGGVNFLPSCTAGMEQGESVGKWVVEHLVFKKE